MVPLFLLLLFAATGLAVLLGLTPDSRRSESTYPGSRTGAD
jgi:hypothetical protein